MIPVDSAMVATIVSWIVLGLIAGYIVHFIDPRHVPGGLFPTLITGIIGAIVGGFIAQLLFGINVTGLNIPSLIIAVIGALAFSYLERWFISPSNAEKGYDQDPNLAGRAGGMVYSTRDADAAGKQGGTTSRKLVNPIQLQKFLKNVDYPATKNQLIAEAKKEGADDNVIYTLEQLPDREYDGPTGISEEIGGME